MSKAITKMTDEMAAQIKELAENTFRKGGECALDDITFLRILGFNEAELKACETYHDVYPHPAFQDGVDRLIENQALGSKDLMQYIDTWRDAFDHIKVNHS